MQTVTPCLRPPVCTQVWEGNGVVASARKIIGATNPLASEPGTIRGDFAIEVGRNVIHGSDSPENGERETGKNWGAILNIAIAALSKLTTPMRLYKLVSDTLTVALAVYV